MVQQELVANRLEKVVAKFAVDRTGKPSLVEILTPDLSPGRGRRAARDTMAGCLWKPAIGPDGQPTDGEITLLFTVSK